MSALSFVIPVYRPDLRLLERCINSLKEQSLKDWDAVFVVDGEDSQAVGVIRSAMKKCPNHYKVLSVEHGGAPKARNTGAMHTTGDNIIFWDSDCLIEPDAAKGWVKIFKDEPEVGFIYSGYRFLEEKGAIDSEPFDPWLLKVRNYISTCFPLRREFLVKWNEDLESLQDWDFWLSVVEKGAKGKFLRGYAFATAYPTDKSISGKGCTPKVWLDRVDAVKKLHGLPERDVCVTSLSKKTEAIWLAKLINADYQDAPHQKPHKYKTIIHMGLSFLPGYIEHHSVALSQPQKHVVFYTCDDITEIQTSLNLRAVWTYSALANANCFKQYVEDKSAMDQMTRAGFDVEIMPLPLSVEDIEAEKPEGRPVFALEIADNYGHVFNFLQASLPDIELTQFRGAKKVTDYTGLVHFHPDKTLSSTMKKFALCGRSVVSNVQAPFMGYVDDARDLHLLIPDMVEKIRAAAWTEPKKSAKDYYKKFVSPEKLLNVITTA